MKRIFAYCFLLLLMKGTFAQVEFMHSLGGKYFFYSNADGLSAGTFVYAPRVNVSSTESSSISVGTRLGLGFSIQSGPAGSSSSLVLDLPVLAEYNVGYGSTRDNESGFGGYVGAGFGIHRVSQNTDGYGGSATLYGPVFSGGIRFNINAIGPLEIGGSYMLDLKSKDVKFNILGISVSYILGLNSY